MTPRDAAWCLTMLRAGVDVAIRYDTFWPRGLNPVRRHLFDAPGRLVAEHAAELAPEVDAGRCPRATTTVQLRS